ncbi:M48 family metallopeptidase [bacterium]|nr:M48 family metallopeptidase [bacterium]
MSTKTHKISVDNITIDVVRKNIKNLHLAVYPPYGRVRIATPRHIDDEALRLFAISKLSWIKKHRSKFKQQKCQSPREYVSGESHYYKGQRYLLNVIYQKAPFRNKAEIRNKKYLDLYVREGSNKQQRRRVLTEWYRHQLKYLIPGLIEKWEGTIGVKTNDWGVKRMKTKWGTCNVRAKRVWINLELAKRPPQCLEYILVHELVHLLERNHNIRFTSYMDKFLSNWRFIKEELNSFPISYGDWDY